MRFFTTVAPPTIEQKPRVSGKVRKKIFACLFSVHNTLMYSHHEQVCLMRLRFDRYLSHHYVAR